MARSIWRWAAGLAVVLVLGVGAWLIGWMVLTTDGAVAVSAAIDPWDTIQETEGGYAVEMPTKPINTMTDLTREIRAYGWTINRTQYRMGVFYIDLPGTDDPQRTFAVMTDIFSHAQGVERVTTQRFITRDGNPGLELEYEFNAAQTGVTRFFDSFRFLTP